MSSKNNVITSGIFEYILVAYEIHELGCMECVRKRIEDRGIARCGCKPSTNTMDQMVIEALKQEVLDENGNYYYVYNLLTKSITKLRMIQYPQCFVCGNKESIDSLLENAIIPKNDTMTNGFRTRSFNETIEVFRKEINSFLHPQFGLFHTHNRNLSDSMPLISLYVKVGRRDFDAHGRQKTYKESFFTAILEGLERFHGVVPTTFSRYYTSEQSLLEKKQDFVSLHRFQHLVEEPDSKSTIQLKKYTTDANMFWRYAYALHQKKYVLLPEEIIYFSTHDVYDKPFDKRYILDSSNGISLGSNILEASLGGLFEVIERDSFLVHWYSKSSPIKLTGIKNYGNREINLMITYLETIGYNVHIFDITLESHVPTFWVLLELKDKVNSDKIAFYTTAGTNIHPEKAIESALIEASTSIRAFHEYQKRFYKGIDPIEFVNDYKKVEKLEDHLYLYSSPTMQFAFDFALETNRIADATELIKERSTYLHTYSSQTELFEAIIDKLLEHHEIYQANLSSRTLKKLGLNCVKIIIPTMQNIGFGYVHQNINRERISQAVYVNRLDGETEELNREPHPFP